MKKIDTIISELALIGEKYPKQKGGYFGMFTHDHQDLAKRLIKLNDENIRPTSLHDLANQVSGIFNEKRFIYNSSLLRSVVNCLYDSKAFNEYNALIDEMKKTIEDHNSHNDGGGRVGWNVKHDMAAIRKLSDDKSFELKCA